jgi:phthalate 4,5-dioxygenase
MLSELENERITRVGPGTPMGNVMRNYWLPAVLSSELPENGGAPVPVRLLGEDLVAFRDRAGDAGVAGAGAYPAFEGGGVVWTYLGPRETMPAPPNYEWVRVPPTHRFVSKTFEHCNWLQAMEGGLDTAHSSFLHNEKLGDKTQLRRRDGHPRIEVEKTEYGYRYASIRNLGDEETYVRVYHYAMPFQQMRGRITGRSGGRVSVPKFAGHLWVPIDDVTTFVYNTMWSYDASTPITEEHAWEHEARTGRGKDDMLPRFKLKANMANDFFIDRARQKTQTYTGIKGINTQDMALQEGMGPICDRTKEHLGTSDRAVIAARQLLFEACDEVEQGRRPRGADPATHGNMRPYDSPLPAHDDWHQAFSEELVAKW